MNHPATVHERQQAPGDATTAAGPRAWDARAAADIAPALIGLAPFGFLLGVQIAHAPINGAAGVVGGFLIYGGSAQLSVLTLMGQGAAVVTVLGTAVLVNLRLLLYGAALEPHFRSQPGWFRWLAPHLLIDPSYAVAAAHTDLADPRRFRRYWLTVGAVLGSGWLGAMTAGVLLGSTLPSPAALHFVPVVVFVGLLVPILRTRADAVAASVGAIIAAGAARAVPGSPGLVVLVGCLGGMLAGVAARRVTS